MTAKNQVEVSAPSRLHFGLLSFGPGHERQFGGAGIMVEGPRTVIRVTPDRDFVVQYGPLARRIAETAQKWSRRRLRRRLPLVRIELLTSVPRHVGLGSGTQLALALAMALDLAHGLERSGARELAASVDRGLRSAVGTYGFLQGGLIVEEGRAPDESLAPLHTRIALPPAWRFVLIQPRHARGPSGTDEQAAFDRLPPVPPQVRKQLWHALEDQIIPAARQGDAESFGEGVFHYGRLAGACFSLVQYGPFASAQVAAVVEFLRASGIPGVGQSSWGPTVFALAPTAEHAIDIQQRALREFRSDDLSIDVVAPDNLGASATLH